MDLTKKSINEIVAAILLLLVEKKIITDEDFEKALVKIVHLKEQQDAKTRDEWRKSHPNLAPKVEGTFLEDFLIAYGGD